MRKEKTERSIKIPELVFQHSTDVQISIVEDLSALQNEGCDVLIKNVIAVLCTNGSASSSAFRKNF